MPRTLVLIFRVSCVAVGLVWTSVWAADAKQHPLVGATRQQIVARFGEPTSQIVTGNREVLFFDRERFELVDNVVTFVERVAADSPSLPAPPPSAAAPSAETPAAAVPPPASQAPARATPPPPAPTRESEVQIKAVRPRDAANPADELAEKQEKQAPPQKTPALVPRPREAGTSAARSAADEDSAPTAAADATPKKAGSRPVAEKKAPVPRPPSEPEIPTPFESIFTTRTYAITAVVVFGGLGYLMWRSRQRQLELEATSVSQTPFETATASATTQPTADATRFTAELLAKLDWKRFEGLVAAYYSRTGVVATLTGNGEASPVHLRISWKGEPRPFANVRCVARPSTPIDVGSLKELLTVLAAEDIRRGYVVTTGDFTEGAREFAREHQLTLLPGSTFLEKLNALPDTARKELLRETTSEAG